MPAASPTQLSLERLRDEYEVVEVVEHWNAHTRRRYDLFGFLDILALKAGRVVGVQTTSRGHVANRIRKIRGHENYPAVRAAGIEVIVHGWDQPRGPRTAYRLREEVVGPPDESVTPL